MPQSPRPEPPVLKRGGFTVREDFFGVDGHPRVSDGHLRLLFSSQHPGPTCGIPEYAIPVYAAEAQRLFSRPFFAAQLRYYGIEHMAASNRDELGDLLEEAARTGEVRHSCAGPTVPPSERFGIDMATYSAASCLTTLSSWRSP